MTLPERSIAPVPARARGTGAIARGRHWPPALWPLLGILALILLNAAIDAWSPGGPGLFGPGAFLHVAVVDGVPAGALLDVLNYGATFAILGVGMAPVIGTRGVDLSVGSIMALAGAVAATLSVGGSAPAVSIGAALGVAALCGAWNGVLVAGAGIQPFVATLVLMVAGRGIAQMVTQSQIVTFHDPVLEYLALGRPAWLPVPFAFLLAALLLLLTLLVVRRTALGLLLEAVGGNPEAARLAGVRSALLVGGTYVFSAVTAGVAGLIAAANIKAADPFNAGRNLELAAIFAVIVGGTPQQGGRMSILGAALGGFLMQALITTMYARDIGADVAPLPEALAILAVCIVGTSRGRRALARLWSRS